MTDDQFSKLISLLTEIRDALTPGALEWMSGLVVPLVIGGLTLWVALSSVRVTRRSNELAAELQKQQMSAEARRLRIPFATYLMDLAIPRLFRRLTAQPVHLPSAEQLAELVRLRAASDEPSAQAFEVWVLEQADAAPTSGKDAIEEFITRSERLRARAEMWKSDPAAAMSMIGADG